MELEKEWKQYPVLHLDLSSAKNQSSAKELKKTLLYLMEPLVEKYGKKKTETLPGKLLAGLIRRAYEQTGAQVAVIIDEYDAPLLDVLHEEELLPEYRRVMQEFYQPLKASEAMIRFCFITGITKFSQLSIFSTINNLTNISMDDRYAAICGITEQELATDMAEDIRQMQHFQTDITAMDRIETIAAAFDQPTENMDDALPLLYQSGYITIKEYDRETDSFVLAIPNKEVRESWNEMKKELIVNN